MRAKVFMPHVPSRYDPVTQRRTPVFDMKPATRYGELVPLVNINVDVRTETMHDLFPLLQEGLQNMTQDDYILCVGDPVLIAAAISYAHDLNGQAKVLRWDRNRKEYDFLEVVL